MLTVVVVAAIPPQVHAHSEVAPQTSELDTTETDQADPYHQREEERQRQSSGLHDAERDSVELGHQFDVVQNIQHEILPNDGGRCDRLGEKGRMDSVNPL